jgi:hypothetical protein
VGATDGRQLPSPDTRLEQSPEHLEEVIMRNVKETVKDAATVVVGIPAAYISAFVAGAALAFGWVVVNTAERVIRQ